MSEYGIVNWSIIRWLVKPHTHIYVHPPPNPTKTEKWMHETVYLKMIQVEVDGGQNQNWYNTEIDQ